MNKVFAIIISGLFAWLIVASLGGSETAMASPAGSMVGPQLTAWRCPITDQFFTNPLTCKRACFNITCQAVSQ
jgi:hypothetical protein